MVIIFIVINVLAVGGCCVWSSRSALHGTVDGHLRGRLQKVDTRTGGAGKEVEGHCRWVPWDLHHLNWFLPSVHQYLRGRDSSVCRESNWKARRNTDVGLSPRCGKGFYSSPCQLSVGLSYGVHTAPICNRMHNICVDVKKVPNTCSHCLVTWKYCTHW